MKRIGLIGGISWHSSMDYYRILNELVNQNIGPNHSANVVLINVDSGIIQPWISKKEYDKVYQVLLNAALSLQAADIDILGLCANGAHYYFDRLQNHLDIPMVHIADAIGEKIRNSKLKKIGLLGVKITMESTFYQERLKKYEIEVVTPDSNMRNYIHESILSELTQGIFLESTREKYLAIMNDLHARGCEGIILGCTEIPMLISQDATQFPLFSSTEIHCEALLKKSMELNQ